MVCCSSGRRLVIRLLLHNQTTNSRFSHLLKFLQASRWCQHTLSTADMLQQPQQINMHNGSKHSKPALSHSNAPMPSSQPAICKHLSVLLRHTLSSGNCRSPTSAWSLPLTLLYTTHSPCHPRLPQGQPLCQYQQSCLDGTICAAMLAPTTGAGCAAPLKEYAWAKLLHARPK